MRVRYAVGLPTVGEFGDPGTLVDLAVAAEEHGWDGAFVWDHVLYREADWPVANPVVVAAAIAARTRRIRLGVLMTVLPRRRMQVVAREVASLHALSRGRVVFGAALGSMDSEYAAFGEDPDLRVRAARLDESLDALAVLWTGDPVELPSRYTVRMLPAPAGGVPIWCAGRWPTQAGFRRAARWNGVVATFAGAGRGVPVPPDDFAAMRRYLAQRRGSLHGFDIAMEGESEPATAAATVAGYPGLTWWIEAMGWWRGGVAAAQRRIAAGPPGSGEAGRGGE